MLRINDSRIKVGDVIVHACIPFVSTSDFSYQEDNFKYRRFDRTTIKTENVFIAYGHVYKHESTFDALMPFDTSCSLSKMKWFQHTISPCVILVRQASIELGKLNKIMSVYSTAFREF